MNRSNVLIFIRRNESKNENEQAKEEEKSEESVMLNGKVLIRLEYYQCE